MNVHRYHAIAQPTHHASRLLAILFLVTLLGGCMETRVVKTYGWWEEGGSFQRDEDKKKKPGFFDWLFKPKEKNNDAKWTIFICEFKEEDHVQRAAQYMASVEARTNYQDLWIDDEEDRSTLYAGHYNGGRDPNAATDLLRWQQMQANGQLMNSAVVMTPIIERHEGGTPEWNLLNAKDRGDATLEIASFDEEYGKGFREAAEMYVAELRQDKHEAYYYHGPTQSAVTIGIFHKRLNEVKILKGGLFVYGPKVEALRTKKPFNIRSRNGRVIIERTELGIKREQPSLLVEIPGSY